MTQRNLPQSVLKYARHLRETYADLRTVYLFGSHARGSSHPDSDIDIAAVFSKVSDSFDLQVQLMKIRRKYDTRIEPHVFKAEEFNASNPMASEIIRTGIEIQ